MKKQSKSAREIEKELKEPLCKCGSQGFFNPHTREIENWCSECPKVNGRFRRIRRKEVCMELSEKEKSQIIRQREEADKRARWTCTGDVKKGYIICRACGGAGSFDYSLDEYGSDKGGCSKCCGEGQLSPARVHELVENLKKSL